MNPLWSVLWRVQSSRRQKWTGKPRLACDDNNNNDNNNNELLIGAIPMVWSSSTRRLLSICCPGHAGVGVTDEVAQLVERRPQYPMDRMTWGSIPARSSIKNCERFSESRMLCWLAFGVPNHGKSDSTTISSGAQRSGRYRYSSSESDMHGGAVPKTTL